MSKLLKTEEKKLPEKNSFHVNQIGSDLATYLAIGETNKRTINCVLEFVTNPTYLSTTTSHRNAGANDYAMHYIVPLPTVIGSLNLIITDTIVGITDSDATDYLDRTRLYGVSTADPPVIGVTAIDIDHDTVHGTGTGKFTYGHADITIGGTYEKAFYYLNVFASTASQFDFAYLLTEYYYG